MLERESRKEIKHEKDSHKGEEVEIDLLDILRKIIVIRKTIYKAAGIGLVIGLIVAISIPKQYTVRVTLSPEMGTAKGGGLSSFAASFLGSGTSMGEGTDALNASMSAEIVSSTPFLLELLNLKVPVSNEDNITLSTYLEKESSPWWVYIFGFPNIVIGEVKSLFANEEIKVTTFANNMNQGTIELSEKELQKVDALKRRIAASVDKKTSMTSVTVTLQNPKVAAIIADSVVKKLQEYIIDYRTTKAKEDCIYLEKLYKERQQEYYVTQKKYANYIDSHENIILQSIRAEQERLQNDMSLAYQVYSQVANQLQVARAKIQEEKPVFAIVEPAVIPLMPSSSGMKIYVLAFICLSVIGTIGWELIVKDLWKRMIAGVKAN